MSDARDKILARRAKFVAAALAGISAAYGEACKPEPCLKVAPPPSADAAGEPSLAPAYVPLDGAAGDAGAEETTSPEPIDAASSVSREDAGRPVPTDAGTSKPIPPATREVRPPVAPPRPCLLVPIPRGQKR